MRTLHFVLHQFHLTVDAIEDPHKVRNSDQKANFVSTQIWLYVIYLDLLEAKSLINGDNI